MQRIRRRSCNNGTGYKKRLGISKPLFDFVMLCKKVLSKNPLFVLISSYTTGLQPTVLKNILSLCFGENNIDADEIGLSCQDGLVLPCGARGLKVFK